MIDYSEYAIARFGVLLLFCVYPFVLKNSYFKMTALRFHFFCLVCAGVFFLLFVHRLLISRRPFPSPAKLLRKNPFGVAFAAFCFFMFLSAALSIDRDYSFFGNQSRYLGALFYIAVLLATLWITGSYVFTKQDLILFQAAACCACLLAFVQYLGLDVFDMRKVLRADQRLDFISTLGNIGVFSEYVCLLIPPAMFRFCFSESRKTRVFCFFVSFMGFLAILCADCDAGYLGFGAAVFVLFLLVCRRNGSVSGVFILIFGFAAAAAGIGMIRRILPEPPNCSAVTAFVTETVFPYAVLLISALCIILLQRRQPSEKARRGLFIVALALAGAAIVTLSVLIWYFTVAQPKKSLLGFEKYLRFNSAWGSTRGFIWRRCSALFRKAPLFRKLFGYGEETLVLLFKQYYSADMKKFGFITNNAHNVYLQYLLTTGILGLASFLAVLITSIRLALRKDRPVYVQALALSLAAFAAESVVTITQPISSPFLFLIFAVIAANSDAAAIPDIRFLFHSPEAAQTPQPLEIQNNTGKDV